MECCRIGQCTSVLALFHISFHSRVCPPLLLSFFSAHQLFLSFFFCPAFLLMPTSSSFLYDLPADSAPLQHVEKKYNVSYSYQNSFACFSCVKYLWMHLDQKLIANNKHMRSQEQKSNKVKKKLTHSSQNGVSTPYLSSMNNDATGDNC